MIFFLVFLYNVEGLNPILYVAIMALWLAALPGFIIISSVSGIVNVMCLVLPTTACLHILEYLGAILIAQCSS